MNDLIPSLHPPRLPEAFVQIGLADYLFALGLGLICAALLGALLTPLRAAKAAKPTFKAELAQVAHLPPSAQMRALLELSDQRGISVPADLRAGLYGPTDAQATARLLAHVQGGR